MKKNLTRILSLLLVLVLMVGVLLFRLWPTGGT